MSTLAKVELDDDDEFLRDLLTEPEKKDEGFIQSIAKRVGFSGEPEYGPVGEAELSESEEFLRDLLTEPVKNEEGVVRKIGRALNIIGEDEYGPVSAELVSSPSGSKPTANIDGKIPATALEPMAGAGSKVNVKDQDAFLTTLGNRLSDGFDHMNDSLEVSRAVASGGWDDKAIDTVAGAIKRSIERNTKKQERMHPQEKEIDAALDRFGESEGWWGTTKAAGDLAWTAATNPIGLTHGTAEQLSNMLPTIAGSVWGGIAGAGAGGVIGSAVPGVGTAAGALSGGVWGARTGMAGGTAVLEFGNEVQDAVQDALTKRGLEPTQENIKALLSDKGYQEQLSKQASIKGIVLGTVDAFSLGLAGRIASGPARKAHKEAVELVMQAGNVSEEVAKGMLKSPAGKELLKKMAPTRMASVKAGAGAVATEMAGEPTAEALSQLAARGEIDKRDVAAEGLYGAATSGGSATVGRGLAAMSDMASRSRTDSPEQPLKRYTPPPALPAPQDGSQQAAPTHPRVDGPTDGDLASQPAYPDPPPPGKRWVTDEDPDSGTFVAYLEDDPDQAGSQAPSDGAVPAEQPEQATEVSADTGPADGQGQASPDVPQEPAVPISPTHQDNEPEEPISDELQPKHEDPVNAAADIDKEIAEANERLAELSPEAGFGPMFDDERAELIAKIQTLQAERATIAKAWPQMQQGAQTRFATEDGDHLDAHYALVEADDLVASHDVNLRVNPSYPAEMQPRDRTRAASEMQVSGIAQKLDPMRLGASSDAGSGSPIVGADGAVESGNGRTIALMRVYQANGQKAQDYRDYLRENAGQFGLTAEQVQAMQNPVLVRVRTTPVDRAEFAKLANASTVAPMSDQEQAAADVDRITDMSDLVFDDNGEFNNAASREFILRFISKLPPNEQGLMYDSDGNLSAKGYARVRNAILAKAYGDSPVLKRMTESLDDNIRNISKALLYVAPKMAMVRDRIADGSLHDLDATPDIVAAVGELSRLKQAGAAIEDALNQMTMFGDGYSEITRDLLRFLADNNRSPRRIANMLDSYLNFLIEAGNPNQGALLDNAEPPTKEALVKAAIESARKPNEQKDDRQQTIFGGDQTRSPEDGVKPDDARSDGKGTEGAEGAGQADTATEVRQFDSLGEAEAHIKKNKMGATHGVFRAGENRYEVRPKKGAPEATQAQPSPKVDAEPKPEPKPKPKKAAKTSPKPKAAPKAKPKAKSKAGEESPLVPQEPPAGTPDAAQPSQPSAKKESRASEEPAAPKIEDFGEKMEGARKDYAQSYSEQMHAAGDVDIAAQPLSKSWPASDYAKLLEAGMDPRAVGFMRAARDAVPPKPRMRNKLIAWAEQVKALRDFAQAVMQDPALVETILSQAPPVLQETVLFQAQMYVELGHEKSLAGLRLVSNRFNIYEGVKYDPPRTIWSVQKAVKASAMSNWPQIIASGDTREKAITAFKNSYGELGSAKQERGATSFDIYSYRGKPGYVIGKKVGRNRIDLKRFDDVKSARAYLANNHNELVDLLEKAKFIPSERRASNSVRVGVDHRVGVDVTPEMFSDTFGFRGVQFGNQVEAQRRQADLNEAYDALLDMAGVLNVPPRALSLAGQLGLAFGARGRGGANAPKAHYERNHVVINLTKKKGAGSLAHEWWHALDSYFARKGGRPDEMITDGAQVATDSVRRQTMQAYATVVRAVMNNGMLERSRNLDKRRSSPYWSTTPEMTARAFESYIINRLQDQGQANDYLANIVSEAEFNLENAYPYPTAGEVKAVRAAFDEFFRTVETREDGDVVAFESVSADPAPTGMTVGAVQSLIAKVTAKLPESSNLQIRAVRSRLDVQDAEGRLPSFGAEAIYFPAEKVDDKLMPARIYLIANRLSSARRAQQVLAHEFVGHFGMEALLGKDFAAVLADVARVARAADGANVAGQRPGDEHYATMDAVAHDYPGLSQAEQAREVLARMAEVGEHPSLLDRAYAAIRRFLRQLGLSIAYSKSELKTMIAEAAERLRDASAEGSVQQSMDASDSLRTDKARASDALESRDRSQSVEIVVVTGNEFGDSSEGTKPMRESARAWARKHVQGREFRNAQQGWNIRVGRRGLGETFSRSARVEKIQSVAALPQLLESAILGQSQRPKLSSDTSTKAIHTMYAPVRIGEAVYLARLVIREASNGTFFYDHDVSGVGNKKAPESASNIDPGSKPGNMGGTPRAWLTIEQIQNMVNEEGRPGWEFADTVGEPGTVYSSEDNADSKAPYNKFYEKIKTRPETAPRQLELGFLATEDLERRILGFRSRGIQATVLGSRILANFKAGKPNLLVGSQVSSPADLAILAQVYRDPRFETFRVIYVDDKSTIVGEAGYTSRLPASASFPADLDVRMKADMNRFSATGYYMMHNHPSGSSAPSRADMQATKAIAKRVKGFKSHVVIDHNEFSTIAADGNYETKTGQDQLKGIDFTSAPELEHKLLGTRVASVSELAVVAKALQIPNGHATVVLTNAQGLVQLLVDIPVAALDKYEGKKQGRKVAAMVRRAARQTGSGGHRFLVLPDKAVATRPMVDLVRDGVFTDVVRADGDSVGRHVRQKGPDLMMQGRPMMVSDRTSAYDQQDNSELAWLNREAVARGMKDFRDLEARNTELARKLRQAWKNRESTRQAEIAKRANEIINDKVRTVKPLSAMTGFATRISGVRWATSTAYTAAGRALMKSRESTWAGRTFETIKSGIVSDYGLPESVVDQRALLQGRQRVQLRKAGNLIEKLATLTRAESRVAYNWMNEKDHAKADALMKDLPEDSVFILGEIRDMIDQLSRQAVRLGQLTPEAYERNKFAYLRRSYEKHTLSQDKGQRARRSRTIAILGEQYKGRGLTVETTMKAVMEGNNAWWMRKLKEGKADDSFIGKKLVRLERRVNTGEDTVPIEGVGDRTRGRIREVIYYPADEALPARYEDWTREGVWEVRTTKGNKLVLWRDFTKQEREKMGEIDEARFAIAKTLHAMIHDVEVGHYLKWIAAHHAVKPGDEVPGTIVPAGTGRYTSFKPSEWVKVPTTTVEGTRVPIFGALAGRYIPGPIWNEVRQTAGDNSQPWGRLHGKLLTMWKTSKTALSPTVHTNNIMSNVLMSDWHDVGAAHVLKSIRILLAASDRKGRGIIGRTGNALSRGGITDREAAREIVNRYLDSGGAIGTWAAEEITRGQMDPLLRALEEDLQANGETNALKIGVFSAMQHMLMGRVPMAYEALAKSKPVKAAGTEARSMIDLYQTEDDIFRLATWLKAKEDGHSDKEAGKKARKSFMDYHINAPWIQALRGTVLPFVSFTYRAVPMILHTAARNPHKLLNLMLVAGALNALGVFLSGADENDERKLLPDEKSGDIWGIVPKLMRMPWNDDHDSPVYMDVRRFVPVGDFFDTGQVHAAVPLLPALQLGGPLWTVAEVALNKSSFTGREITLATDTPAEKAAKTVDHLYKSMAPNILGLPGSYATKSVGDAIRGRTDAFGRERSVAQSVASSFGFKLASYPSDTLLTNLDISTFIQDRELKRQIRNLERQRDTKRISEKAFDKELARLQGKREKLGKDRQAKRGY